MQRQRITRGRRGEGERGDNQTRLGEDIYTEGEGQLPEGRENGREQEL